VKQHQEWIEIQTAGRGTIDVSFEVQAVVARAHVQLGLCTIHCAHTSCSLLIQENADPAVQHDLLAWLERVAPDGDPDYTHTAEGPDDMAAHLRSALTRTGETIPISAGRLTLGSWQGIYLLEHRSSPHRRRILVHIQGT
jgi:secondary thiamine-phosphate synthase enzyme